MAEVSPAARHGDLGTFIIRVQCRRKGSWQGTVTWVETNETIPFRSVWELIRLIARGMDTVSDSEEPAEEICWPE